MFYVGIDWGAEHHTITVIDELGEIVKCLKIRDVYQQYLELLDYLRSLAESENIIFSVEKKDLRLVDFLIIHGYNGFYLEPKALHRFRSRYSQSNAKSDSVDSFILADVLRTDPRRFFQIQKESDSIRKLKILLQDRETFVKDKNRLTNRLIQSLREYYPEFLEFFEDPACPTALTFLASYPTFGKASKLDIQQLKEFLKKVNFHNSKAIEKIAEILKKESIPVDKVIIETKSMMASSGYLFDLNRYFLYKNSDICHKFF